MSTEPDQNTSSLEKEFADSEARFYNVVDVSPDGIVVIDSGGLIRFINDTAQAFFARKREDLLGKEFGFPVVSDEKTEIEVLSENGKLLILEMRVVKIVWETELAYLASLRDITDHIRTINDLNESNKELMHFSYAVTHDIKSPLRNVQTLSKWLLEDYSSELSSKAAKDLQSIDDNISRRLRLVDGLIQFTHISAPKEGSSVVELRDVVDEAIENIHADIVDSGAKLVVDELPSVRGIRSQLVSLFQNLLSNGVKYRGQAIPEIFVSAKRRKYHLEISVSDNGIGIEMPYWDRIFEPFERLHGVSEYDGSGIGLASCKKIVDRHDGRIWVESEPGAGSTFFVLLPAIGYLD